jgi:hypothetical protein
MSVMTDEPKLRLADPDEVVQTLSFALRYLGRKRSHQADEMVARIAAERLVEHLTASGYVILRTPESTAPSHGVHMPPHA